MQIGVNSDKAVDQRRAFVIEEDDTLRASLQFILHDEIETHELASPDDAFAKGVGWLVPHIVLLGVSFLKAEGNGLIGDITRHFPGVRILVVTGPEDEAQALSGVRAGAHGVLVKPLTLPEVRRSVDRLLGRGRAAPLVRLGGL